jgi:hypothetical protein
MSADTLHLVLTRHWYDETAAGRKRVEYRALTTPLKDGPLKGEHIPSKWLEAIWLKQDTIAFVRFARAYTSTMMTFAVVKIDIGPCPIPGWSGDFYRIHFTDLPTT